MAPIATRKGTCGLSSVTLEEGRSRKAKENGMAMDSAPFSHSVRSTPLNENLSEWQYPPAYII